MGFSNDIFRTKLLESIPSLKTYARTLTSTSDAAEDLVQESLLRAWEKRSSLEDLVQIKPWLYAIMRNKFYSTLRKTKNEVEDPDGEIALGVAVSAPQDSAMELDDVTKALHELPKEQQQSVMLICVERLSYIEAAQVCGCQIGTLKSRVNRARNALMKHAQWAPASSPA